MISIWYPAKIDSLLLGVNYGILCSTAASKHIILCCCSRTMYVWPKWYPSAPFLARKEWLLPQECLRQIVRSFEEEFDQCDASLVDHTRNIVRVCLCSSIADSAGVIHTCAHYVRSHCQSLELIKHNTYHVIDELKDCIHT